jgi:Ulp1 family protease
MLQGLKCVMPYPSVKGSMEVEARDLGFLQPDEWLNDVAVDYYLK